MKFNLSVTSNKTTNQAGGSAFTTSSELEVLGILLTSFLKDSHYDSGDDTLKRLEDVCSSVKDKQFLAQAALFARREFGMRSVSHVVAGHLARESKGMKGFFDKVIYRPDDMVEIASYFFAKYKTSLPNALKKGFAKALERFDEYSLAKYRADGKEVSLVDIVNLVHPKSTPALKQLVEDTLRSKDTWETVLSNSLKEAKTEKEKNALKKKAWTDLVKEKKLGYFALLRNLRNILDSAPEVESLLAEQLVNEERIKKSLVLPFRYLNAMKAIKESNSRVVASAVASALDIAVNNVPELPGKTLVVLDASGSMQDIADKASLFAAALYKKNKSADLMLFADNAAYATVLDSVPVLSLANDLQRLMQGGGTNFNAIFDNATKPYDNIVILSDMQAWATGGWHSNVPADSLNAYKQRTASNPKIFSFDLAGYGSLQFPEPEVYALAGISEKTFDIMKLLTDDKQALVNHIKSIEL